MDVLTYGLLNKKVEEAKNVSGEKITEAVNTYLDENPVAAGATSEQVKQIQDNTNKITELKDDIYGKTSIEDKLDILTENFNFTSGSFYNETNNIVSASNCSYSQLVDISLYDEVSVIAGGDFWVTFYGENNNFLYGRHIKDSVSLKKHTLDVSNYSSIRVSLFNTRISDFYFEGVIIHNIGLKKNVEQLNAEFLELKKQNGNNVYHVSKNGDGEYTSLLKCLLEATKYMDSIIYIGCGVYDVAEEFKEHYGETFFDSYSGNNLGMILKNRVHLIFSSDSIVTYEAPVDNYTLHSQFCVFNTGEYGFTLENATIVSKKSRYAIHDERGGSEDSYANKYVNCNITCDNTDSLNSAYPQAIGGGLGKRGYIYINGCIFDAKSCKNTCVSYHNNSAADSKSDIVFTNNYCKKGTFRVTYMGQSQKVSTALCCSNSFDIESYIQAEVGVSAPYKNIELYAFNNVVRQ